MGSINQGDHANLKRWRLIARMRRRGLSCQEIGLRLRISRQAVHHCLQLYRNARTNLTIQIILEWADAYHARTGEWPKAGHKRIPGMVGLDWRAVENALRLGLRGLPGGSSLAKVLAGHRAVRNVKNLAPLTEELILSWADEHYQKMGKWPNENSGEILDWIGETWINVDAALRQGFRSLPGGSSLAHLLVTHLGVRTKANIPRLTLEQILEWADAHYRRTGKWPQVRSGPVLDSPGETWMAVEAALVNGCRGLPGGFSLAKLLSEKRGIRNRGSLPRLEKRKILAWARSHYQRTGRWPTGDSGPVMDAPGETWKAVEMALFQGLRGLRGRTTLSQLLKRNGQRRTGVS